MGGDGSETPLFVDGLVIVPFDGFGSVENNAVAIHDLRGEIGTEKKEKNLYEKLREESDQ